ncbi:MAG: asparagine synthase-related protein, partial [Flammeovirgaceae bacterium]
LLEKSDLDRMLYQQDQPFSTASHFSEFKVFETARKEKMIVMQDGQGSDEYLCGYPEFFSVRLKELFWSFQWIEMMKLLNHKSKHRNTSFTKELFTFIKSVIFYRLIEKVKRLLNKELYPWLSKEWQFIANRSNVIFKENNIRELSISEIKYSSIPYQLHSEDRNSMLFSIESRLPFLDHRLVEYCIGLPSRYKINEGYSKYVLRQAIQELPEPIRYRKDKMGFVAPDPIWMLQHKKRVREDLKHIVQSSSIFSEKLVDRFDKFTEGKLGYEPIYFRAMTLSRFCRLFKINID